MAELRRDERFSRNIFFPPAPRTSCFFFALFGFLPSFIFLPFDNRKTNVSQTSDRCEDPALFLANGNIIILTLVECAFYFRRIAFFVDNLAVWLNFEALRVFFFWFRRRESRAPNLNCLFSKCLDWTAFDDYLRTFSSEVWSFRKNTSACIGSSVFSSRKVSY